MRLELNGLRRDRGALVAALQAAGATVTGDKVRCPFHDDAHASGAVHELRGGGWAFTCHACDWRGNGRRTGDVLDVVRRARGLDFKAACAALGIAAPKAPKRGGNGPQIDAAAPGATLVRGQAPREPVDAADGPAGPDVGELAAECAARLQADPDALGRLWSTRAIDAATAERFGLGIDASGRYWTLPIAAGGHVVAQKHHRADPDAEPKCWWLPRGAESRHAYPVHLAGDGPVWLCPGELKALGVVATGRPAVGITSGEKDALPDGLAGLLAGRAVAVVADDDKDGREWGAATVAALRAGGCGDVRLVPLGLDRAAGLKDVGDWLVSRVTDGKAPDEIAAELDAAWERADPWLPFTVGEIWRDAATWAPVYHVPTGLAELDAGLGGGLRVGGAHLIVGKSGRAKTQTAAQVALNAARAGVPVGFVSLEMSRRDVAHLLAANLADVPRGWLGSGELRGEPAGRVRAAVRDFAALPLVVADDDAWCGALTRSGLVRLVGDGCRRFGWRLVVVDYLGLLGAEPSDGSEYTADLENSAALKRLARVQDVALVVVAALRKYPRAGKDADRATGLDDVLGAGRIVYDAFNVFDLDCEQAPGPVDPGSRPAGLVRLRPLKTRFAGLGTAGRELQFRWLPSIGRVCDLERETLV